MNRAPSEYPAFCPDPYWVEILGTVVLSNLESLGQWWVLLEKKVLRKLSSYVFFI